MLPHRPIAAERILITRMATDHQPQSAIERNLRAAALRARKEVASAKGISAATFGVLAERAASLEADLGRLGAPEQAIAVVADHRRLLRDVQKQLDQPGSGGVPPTNDSIYAAAIEITETEGMIAGLRGASAAWLDAAFRHLAGDEDERATRRIELLWASLCRRAQLRPTATPAPSTIPMTLDQDGWRVGCAFAVAVDPAAAVRTASDTLRKAAQPGLVILEVGGIVPVAPGGLRVADDESALKAMAERLDAFIVDHHDAMADAADPDFAFGVAVHATMTAINAASGRMLFANHFRLANLCAPDDPRMPRLKRTMDAIAKAGQR